MQLMDADSVQEWEELMIVECHLIHAMAVVRKAEFPTSRVELLVIHESVRPEATHAHGLPGKFRLWGTAHSNPF